jgi:membrane protease YdiL (CAAX protease family)
MLLARTALVTGLVAALALVVGAWDALRDGLPGDGVPTLLADALAVALLLAVLAVAGAAWSREPLAARLGLRAGRFDAGAHALGALGLVGLSHAIEGVLTLAGAPPSETLERFAAALAGAPPAQLALAVAVFAAGSAGAEELFFRGLVQRGLTRIVGAGAAIAIAALAFGAAHVDVVHAAAALPLGLYLGALAHADGSIRAALAAHAANNAVAVLEAGLGVRLPGGAAALASIGVGLAVAAWAGRAALQRARPAAPPAAPEPPPGAPAA